MNRLKRPSKNVCNLLLIPVGVAVNLLLSRLALTLSLPLFLDSIGTVFVAATGGFLPGVIVGFASNYINSISDPITLYYGVISVLMALAADIMARKGVFKTLKTALIAVPVLAFIGGGLGSLLTWALYGLNIGTGISAPYALSLAALGIPDFFAQLFADLMIDIADKIVTVGIVLAVIKLMKPKLLGRFALGSVYCIDAPGSETIQIKRRSLKTKVMSLIIATALIIGSLSVSISFLLYENTMNGRYEQTGISAANLISGVIDPDSVDTYLSTGEKDEAYEQTVAQLKDIKESIPDIKYIYVYRILEDGCHVVYDIDTEDTPGAPLGAVIDVEQQFVKYMPTLLAGGEIEPVISNGQYGWLLTVYKPLIDSEGECTAYAAADIDMKDVISDRYIYIIRMVSLLFAATVIITSFAIWYAGTRIVDPLNALADAAGKFAYDSAKKSRENPEKLRALDIKTGDEIENLYDAMLKTTDEVALYMHQIDFKNEELMKQALIITKMRDNIVICFANLVENRDALTGSHIKRTAAYVKTIALSMRSMGMYEDTLTDAYIDKLEKSAPLHDIGKIRVPDSILNKPGKLTYEEFEEIKKHTSDGREILSDVLAGINAENSLDLAVDMAYCHHERWDGTGYPRGLAGTDIPLCARIMAIADVFDALLSKRSYKEGMPFDKACAIVVEESGTHFDPDAVKAFLCAADVIKEISTNNGAGI